MKLFNVWFLCMTCTGTKFEEEGLVVATTVRDARRTFARSLTEFKRDCIRCSNVSIAEDVILLA